MGRMIMGDMKDIPDLVWMFAVSAHERFSR